MKGAYEKVLCKTDIMFVVKTLQKRNNRVKEGTGICLWYFCLVSVSVNILLNTLCCPILS